ncbi:hypothetical protein [Lacihabitans sp. CS3-21]|uniref:hypothetical protein n=1 Tax=Lacihabitans sp. CS3-21 TaxID=2487332 RepID=UPI0020CC7B37|nr:hypothetical protein [Lacihabitans sp. CS3-21]MCP9749062.1 hypothetical protein [Lacihabitans sp. CS3-21]
MKKLIPLLLFIVGSTLIVKGQSSELSNGGGLLKSPYSHLELRNKGLLIQRDFSVRSVDPNSIVYTLLNSNTLSLDGNFGGTVLDPGGNGSYLQGVPFSANALIEPAILSSSYIGGYQISFDLMDIPDPGDSLIIYEFGQPIHIFSGTTTIPNKIIIRNPRIEIAFRTNNNTQVGQGFILKFIPIDGYTEEIMDNYYGGPHFEYSTYKGSISSGLTSIFNYKNRGDLSFNHGWFNSVSGYNSFTVGSENKTTSQYGFTIGFRNSNFGNTSFVGGLINENKATNSFTFGEGLQNYSSNTAIFGAYNEVIIFDPDDALYNRIPSNPIFIVGTGSSPLDRRNAFVVRNNSNVDLWGYTKLGQFAPHIKMFEITGNMPAANTNGTYPHGLTDAKILSIAISAEVNNQFIPPNYTGNPSLEFNYYWAAGNLYILNKNLNSSGLAGVPFKALITYKE